MLSPLAVDLDLAPAEEEGEEAAVAVVEVAAVVVSEWEAGPGVWAGCDRTLLAAWRGCWGRGSSRASGRSSAASPPPPCAAAGTSGTPRP